ncbi:hypothetical protein D5086_009454 [Populus alba]|uniref:Uncharacterized protein n=1 Tax=Populus alba TaxID=43335 RepID=A0ACC4CJN9_POPAL
MSKSWFFDKDFSGVPDNFFEDTLGCFDFPLEDVEPNGDDGEDWESKFRHLEPPSSNLLTTFSTVLSGEDASSLEPNYNSCSVLLDIWGFSYLFCVPLFSFVSVGMHPSAMCSKLRNMVLFLNLYIASVNFGVGSVKLNHLVDSPLGFLSMC